jgi:hypothetical protein
MLRHLHGTIDWGLFYPSNKLIQEASEKIPEHMWLYTDTDSDHCREEKKRSASCWAVLLLQANAVESMCAADFVVACMGKNACMKLRDLLFEMTGTYVSTEVLVDNQSAVGKLNRPAGGDMWLDLKWRVVHQPNMEELVRIHYIPTAAREADIFTKRLSPIIHERTVDSLGMYCFKQKVVECENSDEKTRLIRNGVKVPLIKHKGIHEGAKECSVCKQFYDSSKYI